MSKINDTLAERGESYGDFAGNARNGQNIIRAMEQGRNWSRLTDHQRTALQMIAFKVGRLLNGDPDHRDSWHDIGGYALLIADEL